MARINIGNVTYKPAVGMHHIQYVGEPTPAEIWADTTWEIDTEYQGRTIIGSGGDYTFGSTGGEEKHKQTAAEVGEHDHVQTGAAGAYAGYSSVFKSSVAGSGNQYGTLLPLGEEISDGAYLLSTRSSGGGEAFNIMQPYTVINFWKRTV